MVGAETLNVEVMKVGVVAAKMEYGVNVRDGVTVTARLSGAEVTVGVNVGVGRISNVEVGASCNSASAVCAAAVLTCSVLDAGSAGIAVRHVAGRLFMADQNVLDLVLPEDSVVNVQYRAAGVTEQVFHPLVGEGADEHFTTR